MKRVLFTAFAVVGATSAFAQVFDMGTGALEERTIDISGGSSVSNVPTVVFDNMGVAPYSAFGAANNLGFDDYTSVSAAPFTLDSLRFIGGVTTAGTSLNFSFFDSSNVFVGGFTSTFGTAGNFNWGITGISSLNLVLPTSGRLQITGANGATGRWFLHAGTGLVGSSSSAIGGFPTGNPPLNHAYQLTAVPEPATMTALGLGVAAMLRRRKAKKA